LPAPVAARTHRPKLSSLWISISANTTATRSYALERWYPFAGRSQATLRLPAILLLGNVESPPETVVYPYEIIEMQIVNDLILPDMNSGQGLAASLGRLG